MNSKNKLVFSRPSMNSWSQVPLVPELRDTSRNVQSNNDSSPQVQALKMPENVPSEPKSSRSSPTYTKNNQAWWQLKTGWSDQEFNQRRTAIFQKIHEKWPERHMLKGYGINPRQELHDLLRPLVASFNNSKCGIAKSHLEIVRPSGPNHHIEHSQHSQA
jgi:hypothetical protein